MKTYNFDFLIAALILLVLILYHSRRRKRLDSESNRIFHFFVITALADVSFDILCSMLIVAERAELVSLTWVFLTIFYILQLTLPIALVYYAQTLRETSAEKIKKEMTAWTIIPAGMLVLVVVNCFNGLLFSVDADGVYHHGPLYMLMYDYALLYAGALAVVTFLHGKEMTKRNVAVLWEFLFIEAGCVLVQAMHGEYLTTGFGISLGVTVLYLTISNPDTYVDHLTGALDKHAFDKWFGERQTRKRPIHVISVNFFWLKHVNKIFGNHVGNQLLMAIAEEFRKLGPHVQVFRISGKSFFLVMQTLEDYEQVREKVVRLFERNFEMDGRSVAFPAIICGIIHVERLPEQTFIAYVDYMNSLVQESRETVMIQSDEKTMNGFIYDQKIDIFLTEAIEKDLFGMYYQPIYSMETNGCIALEALSRLWHPTLGYVPPDVFITLAERTGQILKIGLLQFRRVCRFVKENERIMDQIENIKFNLSPVEILEYGHVQALLEIIEEFELPFSYFQFEITETVATEYSGHLYEVLDLLLEKGITLCLDDFGSGYANLNTVLKLPFSCIKMDRSLLRGLNEDPQVAVFYRQMISVLHELKYQIVSEGVETKEEVNKLREWGVDMIQGYCFSRPVDDRKILEILAQRKA